MELTKINAVPSLSKGYKHTEVGVIPEDWYVKSLSESCVKIQDGNYGESYPKQDEFVPFGVPFLTSKAIGKDGVLIESKIDYISKEKHEELTKAHLKLEDVLFTNRGASVGAIGFADNRICNGNIGPQLTLLRSNVNILTPLFLFHSLKSDFVQRQIKSNDSGSAMNFFGIGETSKFKFPVPSNLEEQKAIATALSDVDALISSLDKLITKKKAIKQGAMQELLTPKDNWRKVSLIELADGKKSNFDDGDWVESEYITDKGIRLIQTGNIGVGNFIDKTNKKYISEDSFSKLKCKEVLEGDLLICRLAEPAGRACVMPNIGESKVITSVDVSIFRGDSNLSNKLFLSQYFTTQKWFNEVIERVGGTTHKRISRGSLGRIEFLIPSLKEQESIAKVLLDMDLEIESLENKKVKYQEIKQGMMQELLTGKTRLFWN